MRKVGEILLKRRLERNLSIKDVARHTKMHTRYIKAMESSDYSIFADSVHIKGFLRNYSHFLDIDSLEVLALFRREYLGGEAAAVKNSSAGSSVKFFSKLKLTPRGSVIFFALAFLFLFGFYLYIQYKSYAGIPPLLIEAPENNAVTSVSEIWVKGRTSKTARILVNGQEVKLTESGSFRHPVTLSIGQNTFIIEAVNRANKSVTYELNVFFEKNE